ncbi:N-myc proto-oncogene protein-like [Lethenteron reissneri]|uniref:N-myc proto-oncogene protein-like n=1 Tax=Lethenteron reissneri TaxID=7753 RepID=UPI002AB5F7CF|nr:N-myc proto-oncogene protein-like [Lethenteron reissneri]XP_061437217.1 N-myc proto-oncogene protein-like [Lethenteron reissneri]XP_061437218.1 N-myc proto-oncogene protein-like [Lethenteron reissneri]XP_061437219.1 N-myc proto-oncogene protein-like [Lethenteron reissneri]
MSAGRDDSPSSSSTFYDGEELHCDWHQSTLPSEDIWKKFELLPPAPDGANSTPTPPPSGDPSREGGEVASRGHVWDPAGGSGVGAVGAMLLRDCMWSSAASSARATPGRLAPADKSAPPPPAVSRAVPSPAAAAVPAEMLPFEPGGRHLPAEGREDGETVVGGAMSPGNETRSDSDNDDDAEDGEIDVVTVEKWSHAKASVALRAVHNTNTAPRYNDNNRRQRQQQRRRPAPPPSTPPVHQQQHNYAAPSPPARGAKTPSPPAPRGSARSRGAAWRCRLVPRRLDGERRWPSELRRLGGAWRAAQRPGASAARLHQEGFPVAARRHTGAGARREGGQGADPEARDRIFAHPEARGGETQGGEAARADSTSGAAGEAGNPEELVGRAVSICISFKDFKPKVTFVLILDESLWRPAQLSLFAIEWFCMHRDLVCNVMPLNI